MKVRKLLLGLVLALGLSSADAQLSNPSRFTVAGDSGTAQVIQTNKDTLTIEGGDGIDTVGASTRKITIKTDSQEANFLKSGATTHLTCSSSADAGKAQVMSNGIFEYCDSDGNLKARKQLTVYDGGCKCDGVTDDSSCLNTFLAGAAKGKAVYFPGCWANIESVVTLPDNTILFGESPTTSGLQASARVCTAGAYIGALCTTVGANTSECGTAGVCTGNQFAPTGGTSYTMLKSPTAVGVIPVGRQGLVNFGFRTQGIEPNFRCTTTSPDTGKPCLQYCADDPSKSCDQSGDCPSGACTIVGNFCAPSGDTSLCGNLLGSGGQPLVPSGAGKINPIDFSTSIETNIDNVIVFDDHQNDFLVKLGDSGSNTTMKRSRIKNFIGTGTFFVHPKNNSDFDHWTTPTAIALTDGITTGSSAVSLDNIDLGGTYNGYAKTFSGVAVTLKGDGSSLSNFNIYSKQVSSGAKGIQISGNNTGVSNGNITLYGNDVEGINGDGVGSYIENVTINGSNGTGQYGFRGGSSNNWTRLSHNFISLVNTTSGTGILLKGDHGTVTGNTIAAATAGLDLNGTITFPSWNIANNYFGQNSSTGIGIWIHSTTQISIVGNSFLSGYAIVTEPGMGNFIANTNRVYASRIILQGSGNQIVNNYLAWNGAGPIISLGSTRTKKSTTGHALIKDNLFHGTSPFYTGVEFQDVGKTCNGGTKQYETCANSNTTDCPGATCGTCCVPSTGSSAYEATSIDGNTFLANTIGIDLSLITSADTDVNQLSIKNNIFTSGVVTAGIKMPATAARCNKCNITGNDFYPDTVDKLVNWNDSMGICINNINLDTGDPIEDFMSHNASGSDNHMYVRTAKVNTTGTGAVTTTLFTGATSTAYNITVHLVGRCTAGAGCTAGQLMVADWKAVYDGASGTIAERAEQATNANIYSYCNITSCASGTRLCSLQPTGSADEIIQLSCVGAAANQTITWHATAFIQPLGT